tara:strand:+ start:25 stop:597 length:573 start_codon:yes stop_codon:yes gene_type:complete
MTKKDNTPEKTNKEETVSSSSPENKQTKTPFWKKHFLSLLLLLGIIIAVLWGVIGKNRLEKSHQAKIEQLNANHNKLMDSIVHEKAKMITSTLALAVRSELIDENKDQVNQYFLQMIKNKQISKIMLVNHKNGEIEMSTNKKDESMTFQNETLLLAKDVISEINENAIITATPIMGLNNQMAVLIVETSK